jgi:hypothetical protein
MEQLYKLSIADAARAALLSVYEPRRPLAQPARTSVGAARKFITFARGVGRKDDPSRATRTALHLPPFNDMKDDPIAGSQKTIACASTHREPEGLRSGS